MREERAIGGIPNDSLWSGLSGAEREHRRLVLDDVRRRVEENGPRVAHDYPGRAQEFMPFAALRGYGDLVAKEMRKDEDS